MRIIQHITYNVGGFKVRENGIGMINPFKTTKPADVEMELDALLEKFQNKGFYHLKML